MNYQEINLKLKVENALLTARCEQYAQAYEFLQDQIIQMRRQIFGKRSERYIDPENKQLSLFDSNSFANIDNTQAIEEVTTKVTAHTRIKNKKKSKDLPKMPIKS